MSVLIKDMEIPTSCFYCPFREKVNPDDYVCMALNKEFEETFSLIVGKRHKDCPLVPVPPHGRLIDADALMLGIQEYIDEYGWDVDEHGFHSEKWCAMKETEMAINDAPTVITADEDGET